MRRILSALVSIVWAMWLGGLGTLILAVAVLFQNPDLKVKAPLPEGAIGPGGTMAGSGAAGIFRVFDRYQLGLAAAALVLTFAWRVMGGAARLKTALFTVFGLATLVAVGLSLYIMPQIEALRLQGLVTNPQFVSLHKTARYMYGAEAVLLLFGGFLLPSILAGDVAPLRQRSASDEPDLPA